MELTREEFNVMIGNSGKFIEGIYSKRGITRLEFLQGLINKQVTCIYANEKIQKSKDFKKIVKLLEENGYNNSYTVKEKILVNDIHIYSIGEKFYTKGENDND